MQACRNGVGVKQVTRKAYAKINLGLDVLGRRENGYHDVRMVMQTVGIHDKLTFTERHDEKIRIAVRLSDGQTEELACDEHNLVYKAAKLLMQERGLTQGVDVELEKNIPIAAGMAGGSTDAAATLLGLNELYDLQMSKEQLCELGVRIGADVPYCIVGGTVLAEGIGEILTGMAPAPQCKFLVVKPAVSVSTAFVYTHLDELGEYPHPDIDALMACIKAKDVAAMAKLLGNVLETVTVPAYPVIQEIKDEMLACGALGALMSGSGPTVFGIFETEEQLQTAYKKLAAKEGVSQIFMTGLVADIEAEE